MDDGLLYWAVTLHYRLQLLLITCGLSVSPADHLTIHACRNTVLEISPAGGADLAAQWFPVTIDADEAYDNGLIRDLPGPSAPEVCTATLTVEGGSVLGAGNLALPITPGSWSCPEGSYYHEKEICPYCPVGYTCPGGQPAAADKIPCPPSE